MTRHLKSATLAFHSKRVLIQKNTEEVAVAEIKIWEVPKSEYYPSGRKYSLFLVFKESGKIIFGIDNHKPKGHHIHLGDREEAYEYSDDKSLIRDFWTKTKEEGFLI